ncbi:hypothetical protein VP01_1841g4 [Puccinia sorghi]|uniref:U3 small nucleolar RNA-associated protein 20 N-terminal domain-containing protein n=1 Tax=Puccinia sorghi TaxID=27349 RepID=A0A0L6VDN8_9BASI|nr:hypothetical protein VP01_1841g4 [Puccinia sorghi]
MINCGPLLPMPSAPSTPCAELFNGRRRMPTGPRNHQQSPREMPSKPVTCLRFLWSHLWGTTFPPRLFPRHTQQTLTACQWAGAISRQTRTQEIHQSTPLSPTRAGELANADARDLFGEKTLDPQFAQLTPGMGSTKIPPTTHDDDNGEGVATENDGLRDLCPLKEALGGLQRNSQLYGSDDDMTRSLGFICYSDAGNKVLVPGVEVGTMTDDLAPETVEKIVETIKEVRVEVPVEVEKIVHVDWVIAVPVKPLRGGGKACRGTHPPHCGDREDFPVEQNVAVPVDRLLEVQKIVTVLMPSPPEALPSPPLETQAVAITADHTLPPTKLNQVTKPTESPLRESWRETTVCTDDLTLREIEKEATVEDRTLETNHPAAQHPLAEPSSPAQSVMTQDDLTSSKIASLKAKFSKRISHFSPTTEGFSKDGAALQRFNSQSSNPPSSKQRNRYSTMSQFIGNGDNESEEQMFSADKALDTDHEDSLTGAVQFLKQHRASGSTDLSAAHLLLRGAEDMQMIGKALGFLLIIKYIKSVPAKSYERRYLKLVKRMCPEAIKRELEGHFRIGLYLPGDNRDDGMYSSLDSLNQILSKYNPIEPHLIGALSESGNANTHFGRVAFGSAGIFFSCGLIQKMNVPGAFEGCCEEFGHGFGGNGMCTKCAIKLTSNVTFKAEPLLHQLDIRDKVHGLFQAGKAVTAEDSWFELQPRIHPHMLKDPLALVGLMGQAAQIAIRDHLSTLARRHGKYQEETEKKFIFSYYGKNLCWLSPILTQGATLTFGYWSGVNSIFDFVIPQSFTSLLENNSPTPQRMIKIIYSAQILLINLISGAPTWTNYSIFFPLTLGIFLWKQHWRYVQWIFYCEIGYRFRNWLRMFSTFINPKAFYCTQDLRVAFYDLLADPDSDLCCLSMECVLTWEDSSLTRHQDDFWKLLDSSQFRDTPLKMAHAIADNVYTPGACRRKISDT